MGGVFQHEIVIRIRSRRINETQVRQESAEQRHLVMRHRDVGSSCGRLFTGASPPTRHPRGRCAVRFQLAQHGENTFSGHARRTVARHLVALCLCVRWFVMNDLSSDAVALSQ